MPKGEGNVNQIMKQGNLIYAKAGDGNFYAWIAPREPFEFRPGQQALAGIAGSTVSGAVATGTRTGAATTTSGTVAASTYWGPWINYSPARGGQVDGLSTGGIIDGQITVGLKCGAGTGTIAPTAQIANTANTSAPTTFLALATTVTCTTAETYASYDINWLQTDANFNAVPFAIRMGVQHNQGGSTAIFRIMESTVIRGLIEPTV